MAAQTAFPIDGMNRSDLLLHLLNFVAPALFLAVLLPLLSRLFFRRVAGKPRWWLQFLLDFLTGVAALVLSVWWLGRDGKMMAYAALVLSVATMQWLLLRGWRR